MRKIFVLVFVLLQGFQITIFSQETDLAKLLEQHVKILTADSLEGRGLGTEGSVLARDYIIDQFINAGIKPIAESYIQSFSFRSGVAWISAENIIGIVEGSDSVLKDEYILIGAHYDHLGYTKKDGEKTIYPGADDNASGVGSIIEIGRYFSENPHLLKRSLIIAAFDAEESGLHGSRHFTENSPVELNKIRLMFSFDMVGMYSANNGLILKGMASLINGAEIARSTAEVYEIILGNVSADIAKRTDTAPFGRRGIPAVHVFTGSKSPYHKPEDQYHLLDYEGMAGINIYMRALLAEISGENKLQPSESLLAKEEQSTEDKSKFLRFGLLINNGSGFHEYKNEFYRANSLWTGSTGLFAQWPIKKFLTLQQEVLYDFNGSAIDGGKIRRHSITFPLNIQIGTPREISGDARLYVFGGGFYRYNFAGKDPAGRLDYSNSYNRNEWGYSAGMGIEVFRFHIGFTARRGLSDIQTNSNIRLLDNNNYFSAGFIF